MQRTKFLVFVVITALSKSCSAQGSQEKFWTSYIEACNPASSLNNRAHFLGSTNPIGPGSVWGVAKGTTNLVATESAYLGSPDGRGKYTSVVYPVTPANCAAQGSRKWDFSLGVPVSLITGGQSADLSTALKNARDINVSIDSVEVDSVPIATWEDSANKVSHQAAAYTDAVDGRHYVMSAAVAITGLTVKYTLNSSLSATAKANIQVNSVVSVGSQQNPAQAQVDVSNDGQTVTLKATGRAYVLGQFLKIDRVKPKDQQAMLSNNGSDFVKSTSQPGPQTPAPQSRVHVNSKVPDAKSPL